MQEVFDFILHRIAALLRANLYDPIELSRGVNYLLPFPMVMRQRFFDVDILASLASPDRCQCMPMIASRDHDGIDIGVVEQLPQVVILFGASVLSACRLQSRLIGIAKGGNPHVGELTELLEQVVRPIAGPDEAEIQAFVQVFRLSSRGRHCQADSSRLLQKLATVKICTCHECHTAEHSGLIAGAGCRRWVSHVDHIAHRASARERQSPPSPLVKVNDQGGENVSRHFGIRDCSGPLQF